MNFILRKSKKEDIDNIINVLKYFKLIDFNDTKKISNNDTLEIRSEINYIDLEKSFIVEYDNQIIGFSHYAKDSEKECHTTLMTVNPEYRKYGIGKMLQEARMNEAIENGFEVMRTWCAEPKVQEWYKNKFNYIEENSISVKHSLYVFTYDDQILSVNLHYGFEEFETQKVLKCDLLYWKKNNNILEKFNITENFEKKYTKLFPSEPNISKPLIINAAITGMVPKKKDNSNVPINKYEIIEEGKKLYDLGVHILHIHARDEITEEPVWQKENYKFIVDNLKKECPGLLLSLTTSGRKFKEFDKRSDVLNLNTDMASLTTGSMNFINQESINPPEMIKKLANKMLDNNIIPEIEVFEPGMINYANYLVKKELIKEPYIFNILLGSLGTSEATLSDLEFMISKLPENSIWFGAGIGKFQLLVNIMSILKGGNIRIGLEDNLYLDFNKKEKASNYDLVKRSIDISLSYNRKIADRNYVNNLFYKYL